MKKPLSIMLSAAMLLSFAAAALPASADTKQPSYEKKEVAAQNDIDSEESGNLTCLFRSDLPEIPFVNAEDYIRFIYSAYTVDSKGNGVYTFGNDGYTMTLDAENDIITFDLYEGFVLNNRKFAAEFTSYPFIEEGNGLDHLIESNGVTLDLSKYDLDIVESDGHVYVPFCTLNDIFSNASVNMTYKKDKLRMGNNDFMGAKGTFKDPRSEEYAQFTYDEFCFAADYFHGKPSNALITKSIGEIGFDKTLDTYNSVTPKIKELLLSDNTEDFCTGLSLLQYYLNDGGHTNVVYSLTDRLAKYKISDSASAAEKVFGDTNNPDVAEIIESKNREAEKKAQNTAFTEEKNAAFKNFELIKDWKTSKLYKTGDTYFYEFFDFSARAVEPFKEAMDYAQAHNAKQFYLFTNAGGDPIAASYMVSLMCDKVVYSEKFIVSGNTVKFSGRIDKNLDGIYDEKDDEVKYDFRCAIIANRGCYSCASIFAGIAQDSGLCVLGEKTSGGSCASTARLMPNGTAYNISGYSMCIRDGGFDTDAGVEPYYAMPGADKNYKGFFDVNELNKATAMFYGDPQPVNTGMYGDLNNDKTVNSADALFVLRMSIGLEKKTDEAVIAADVDKDGDITAADALAILRYSVGLIDKNLIVGVEF